MSTEIKKKFRDDLIRETNPGDVLIERSYYGARFGSETKVFETAHEIASKFGLMLTTIKGTVLSMEDYDSNSATITWRKATEEEARRFKMEEV